MLLAEKERLAIDEFEEQPSAGELGNFVLLDLRTRSLRDGTPRYDSWVPVTDPFTIALTISLKPALVLSSRLSVL